MFSGGPLCKVKVESIEKNVWFVVNVPGMLCPKMSGATLFFFCQGACDAPLAVTMVILCYFILLYHLMWYLNIAVAGTTRRGQRNVRTGTA